MAISKYTLYKYVKVGDTWRYCKAAFHDNAKIKPDVSPLQCHTSEAEAASAVFLSVIGSPHHDGGFYRPDSLRQMNSP